MQVRSAGQRCAWSSNTRVSQDWRKCIKQNREEIRYLSRDGRESGVRVLRADERNRRWEVVVTLLQCLKACLGAVNRTTALAHPKVRHCFHKRARVAN